MGNDTGKFVRSVGIRLVSLQRLRDMSEENSSSVGSSPICSRPNCRGSYGDLRTLEPDLSSETINAQEDRIMRHLDYFFKNPLEKWRAKRRFPWKLSVQIIKIILATVQLVLFGFKIASHVTFLENNRIAFKHLYLKDWDSPYETLPYPPAIGSYAIYEVDEFYQHIDFAVNRYNQTPFISIGTYDFPFDEKSQQISPNVSYCETYFRRGIVFPSNESYDVDPEQESVCYVFPPYMEVNGSKTNFSLQSYMDMNNFTLAFPKLIKASLHFNLKSIHLKTYDPFNLPDCYEFQVDIEFDNTGQSGKMNVDLDTELTFLHCRQSVFEGVDDDSVIKSLDIILDIVVILSSILSSVLCLRSIIRAYILKNATVEFFKTHLSKTLSVHDRMDFVDLWYILIVLNDCITIIGSAFKINIYAKLSDAYDVAGILLGTGNLLAWIGVLRYLGFSQKYNMIIITLKRAFPKVLRFMLCVLVIYFGFVFCGWVVLGPFHIKFRSISSTSECLFSLINGDDMFVTFSSLETKQTYIWYYSRLYLYTFISLFIYVVLNLLISIIIDTYDTIKESYKRGWTMRSDLRETVRVYMESRPQSARDREGASTVEVLESSYEGTTDLLS